MKVLPKSRIHLGLRGGLVIDFRYRSLQKIDAANFCIFPKNSFLRKIKNKHGILIDHGRGALRVPRAVTRLTVYRPLQLASGLVHDILIVRAPVFEKVMNKRSLMIFYESFA